MEKLEEIIDLTIPSGSSSNSASLKLQPGLIIACAIFTNGKEDTHNTGFVTASIKSDSGDIVSPKSHIKNYRDRDAGYLEGKKPLYLDTCGKTYVFEVNSTASFTADFKCQLVLVYEKQFK